MVVGVRSGIASLLAVALLVATVPLMASAQESRSEETAVLRDAFTRFERAWLDAQVPRRPPSGEGLSSFDLVESVGSYATSRHVDLSRRPGHWNAPEFGVSSVGESSRPFEPIPADEYGTVWRSDVHGQVDLAREARIYLKQRLVENVLSKIPFGRSLSKFIDTGTPTIFSANGFVLDETRSRMLPYVSPKFDASERKVAVSLIWKF